MLMDGFLGLIVLPKLCCQQVKLFFVNRAIMHPTFRLFLLAGALFTLSAAVLPLRAEAAMRFCNGTNEAIQAAIAYRGDTDAGEEDWISEGWWQIEPGQCARVYEPALEQRFYFYYATALAPNDNGKPPFIWSGDKYKFCTDTKAFKIEGDGDCAGRNYQQKGFQQIDIGPNIKNYTLDFKDNG